MGLLQKRSTGTFTYFLFFLLHIFQIFFSCWYFLQIKQIFALIIVAQLLYLLLHHHHNHLSNLQVECIPFLCSDARTQK